MLEREITELDIQESLRILRGIPQFERFTDDELTSIVMNLKYVDVFEGDILCIEDEVGEEMYIIKSGEITIQKAGREAPLILTILGSGAIFGEMSLLDGSPRSASALAKSNSTLLVITKSSIDDLALMDENLACNFLIEVIKAACSKIRMSRENLIRALGPLLAKM